MQNLIVLGQVPGTHVQITFGIWLIGAICLSVIAGVLLLLHPVRTIRHWLIAAFAAFTMHRGQQA